MSQPLKLVTGAILGVLAVLFIGSVIATDMTVPSGTTGALTVESDPVAIPALIATNNVIQGQLSGKAATNANVSGFNNDSGFITITPLNSTNALLSARIDELANTTWQDAVIDVDLATPPVSPTTGDRYVVATGGTGDWATKDKNIAQWNGSSWDFTAPVTGMGVNETDSGNDYRYSGTAWTLLTGPAPAKSVSIQELDGSPAIAGATQIKVPNGTLTKSGTSATLAYLSTAVATNLAAGIPTVVGSELRVGTNVTAGITLRGYESTISPSDIFGWYSGGSIANSNNAAPVYWSSTDANGDYLGIGFTASTGALQSRYAFAIPKIPSYASGWNSGTGMVVSVYTTDTGTSSLMDFRITSPNGTQFSTNNLASSVGNTLTHFYIPGTSLPGFSNNTATADWTIRFDFKCKSSATAAVSRVKFQFQ